jgi:predicted nucleic acid-binding protein
VAGYEDLIEAIELPDTDDRHVLAAAIVGGADVIVTYNLKDLCWFSLNWRVCRRAEATLTIG